MVRIKLPDAISSQFLNKALIWEHSLHHTLLPIKHKLDKTFRYLKLTQIQEPVGTDRENAFAFFCQSIKSSDFFCITLLQKSRLCIIDIKCLELVQGLLEI